MPTDEERRKVAQMLRESRESVLGYRGQLEEVGINLFCFDQADYYLIYKSVYGFLPAEHMNTCDYAEFHGRLADLIEPEPERTCRLVPMPWNGAPPYRRSNVVLDGMTDGCPECGYPIKARLRETPNYCPFCGAKVVEDVD